MAGVLRLGIYILIGQRGGGEYIKAGTEGGEYKGWDRGGSPVVSDSEDVRSWVLG